MPPNNQFTAQPSPAPAGAPLQAPGNPIGSEPVAATPKRNQKSSQSTLLLSEIRDNMVIMNDGSFRAVIECESINFDLMSDREREGVEVLYQNFLNALSHPVQILVRSKRVDIGPYLEKLYNIRIRQDNMLLNVLMDDYMKFIDLLAQQYSIMDKSFYVIVPYNNTGDLTTIVQQSKGFFDKLFTKNKNAVTKIDKMTYVKAQDEINRRVESISAGLRQIGIACKQLNTVQLGELYYNFYNPDTAVSQPLQDYNKLASTYVMKGTNAPFQPGGFNG
jgi:type IV secretory pathway VirB4 component